MKDSRVNGDVDHTGDGSQCLKRRSGEGPDVLHREATAIHKSNSDQWRRIIPQDPPSISSLDPPKSKIPDLPPISSATLESRKTDMLFFRI
ncbi:hypothetical protein U1Q18_025242 [Sarracenia purpurea var. burkii]